MTEAPKTVLSNETAATEKEPQNISHAEAPKGKQPNWEFTAKRQASLQKAAATKHANYLARKNEKEKMELDAEEAKRAAIQRMIEEEFSKRDKESQKTPQKEEETPKVMEPLNPLASTIRVEKVREEDPPGITKIPDPTDANQGMKDMIRHKAEAAGIDENSSDEEYEYIKVPKKRARHAPIIEKKKTIPARNYGYQPTWGERMNQEYKFNHRFV